MGEAKSRREADNVRSLAKNGLDTALLSKALNALLKYHEKNSSADAQGKEQLLGTDKLVQVQFGLAKVPTKTSPKPVRVEIPHPLHKVVKMPATPDEYDDRSDSEDDDDDDDNLDEAEVCIIVKEESKPWVKDMVEKYPRELGFVKKVLGLQSLRTKHNRYQQRRELLERFDIFLCDDRILPMVGKAIGKNFFEAKKQPIPLKLTRKEALPFAVQRTLSATFMYISAGVCINIRYVPTRIVGKCRYVPVLSPLSSQALQETLKHRFSLWICGTCCFRVSPHLLFSFFFNSLRAGNTGMPPKKLNENIQAIVAGAADKIPGKWGNIRSISIKLPDSTSLPVYNKTPEELEDIARLAGSTREKAAAEEEEAKKKSKKAASEEKKRKKELAAKSPLVRALKKQKRADADEEEKEEIPPSVAKSAKKKKVEKNEKTPSKSKSKPEITKEDVKSEKKKKRKQSEDGADLSMKTKKESKSKEEFIPSKKFVGSKKGYAFHKGRKGVGYYVDNPPKVDEMAMAALARLANTPMKGSRTPKSGRKGGRGRGRR